MIAKQEQNGSRPDYRETLKPSTTSWLAGMFETGGSIGFTIENFRNGEPSKLAYPYISINTSPERVQVLKRLFEGRHQEQTDSSWRWELKGPRAIEVVRFMEPVSPSRRKVIKAIRYFSVASTMDEKVDIAREWREAGRRDQVTQEQYLSLLKIPAFTAGIFDAIGNIYSTILSPLRLQLDSKNEALILALNERFGGSVSERGKAGTQIELTEATWVTLNPSHQLTLGVESGKNLLKFIAPSLQMNREKAVMQMQTA